MSQPRDDRQDDLFRPALEEIINLRHPLVRLAAEIDWGFLAGRFGSVCRAGPGQPPLPTRLVAGLFILKHMHNLSDEMLCDRWQDHRFVLPVGLPPQQGLRPQAGWPAPDIHSLVPSMQRTDQARFAVRG